MNFYLDTDLRADRIFIAPFVQRNPIYLIEVANRGQADQLLRQLNSNSIKGPLQAPLAYEEYERVQENWGKLSGEIVIFRLKAKA